MLAIFPALEDALKLLLLVAAGVGLLALGRWGLALGSREQQRFPG